MAAIRSVGDPQTVALLEKIFDCFNSKDPSKFAAFVTEDFEFHDLSNPSPIKGRDKFLEVIQAWWNSFPDAVITGKTIVASGNMAAAEATLKATHTGYFHGIPPTGKVINYQFMEIAEFQDGKLKALRAYRDNARIFKQLGAFPLNS